MPVKGQDVVGLWVDERTPAAVYVAHRRQSVGDGLSNTQGGKTAVMAGLRLSPLAQLFLNLPCPVKQDDRGGKKKKGSTGVNRKLKHHCQRAGDTLRVST